MSKPLARLEYPPIGRGILFCTKHPKYKGIHKPRIKCRGCAVIFEYKQRFGDESWQCGK